MTNKELLKLAISTLGNKGGEARAYCGLESGQPWCDAYMTWLYFKGKCKELFCKGTKQTYCPNTIKICRSLYAQIPIYLALPMDTIFFDWNGNGIPDHIGTVEEHVSTASIKTIEGNTNGGVVARKTRPVRYVQAVFRPHFPATYTIGQLKIDGVMGYNTIANLQRALGVDVDGILGKDTVKALQKKAGVKQDGSWQKGTSKAVQKMVGTAVDGAFGKNSVAKLQEWINKQNTPTVAEPTKADKIVARADEYAYKYGTSSKKWKYKGGSPKPEYKAGLKKYLGKTKRISQSDCGYFLTTCVRASGVSKTFLALAGRGEPFPKVPPELKVVFDGKKIPNGTLEPGDGIRYKKKKKGQHAMVYYSDGKIAEAGREHWFPAIKKDTKKYNKSNVTRVQVLRAK